MKLRGRMLSQEFMELPSKKEWPIYYKEIKRPQCLENIFVRFIVYPRYLAWPNHLQKRIKRKEYYNSGEFAADVELVFANAMLFNQEHTGIWEDARTLRVCSICTLSDTYISQIPYRIIFAN